MTSKITPNANLLNPETPLLTSKKDKKVDVYLLLKEVACRQANVSKEIQCF